MNGCSWKGLVAVMKLSDTPLFGLLCLLGSLLS